MTTFVASREAFVDPVSFVAPFQSSLVVGALLYAVLFATVVNYEILSWANKHMPASTIMSFAAVQTAGTTILSGLILHTDVYMGQALGGIGIISGLFLVAHAPVEDLDFSLSIDEEAEMAAIKKGEQLTISDLCATGGFGSSSDPQLATTQGDDPGTGPVGPGRESDRLLPSSVP